MRFGILIGDVTSPYPVSGLLRLGFNWMGIGPLSGPGRASSTPQPPVNINNPTISGTPQVGSTLTAIRGAYTGTVTGYSGQWYRGSTPIAGVTGLTYVLASADLGSTVTYRESAYNADPAYSSTTGISNALGPVTTAVTLGTLTFSLASFTIATPSSGTILGATLGSTITASGLPAGLTINGAARTWAWSGTGTASSGTFTLTETLTGATNTPHASTVSYTINAAGASGGKFNFAQTANSGLLVLLEDI